MLRQMPTIGEAKLHNHAGHCCDQQYNTDPTQICEPEQPYLSSTPSFITAQRNAQQQSCDRKADYAEQARDTMSDRAIDIAKRSEHPARSGNEKK